MRIRSIMLENFRSYKGRNRFELSNINVLIGPNNSGKSNLLRSLQIYRELNLGKRSIGQDQRHTAKRESYHHSFEVEFKLDQSETEWINTLHGKYLSDNFFIEEIKHEIIFDPFVKKENFCFKDSQGNWISLFHFEKSNNASEISVLADSFFSGSNLSSIAVALDPGNLTVFFHLIRNPLVGTKSYDLINSLLGLITSYLSRWAYLPAFRTISSTISRSENKSLNESGANLISVLNYIQMHEPKNYGLILGMLEKVNRDIENFTAPARDQNAYGLIQEKGDVIIELSEFSTGLQQFLLIITFVFTAPAGSLLMIEEPEENIHAKTQRTLLSLMEQFTYDKCHQFIMTSHSTIFARVTSSINTFKIEKSEGASSAIKLEESNELKYIKNLLGHENSDLFGNNAVIIVEGDTEQKVLPIIALHIGIDLVENAIEIINVGGSGNSKKIKELVSYLKNSQTETFIILDNHKDSQTAVAELVRNGIINDKNVFSIDKGFEDSFPDETIVEAFNSYCKDFRLEKIQRNDKPLFENIRKIYHTQTQNFINKPLFGLALVNSAINNGTLKDTTIYQHLVEIYNRIKSN